MILTAAALAIACCLFFHGYEIFNFTLSIDEELNLGGESPLVYIQHGRWGLALRAWLLMPDTTAPIAAIATGLALYGAAFVLLIWKFGIRHWGAVAVAAPLFFGFPILVYDIAFSNIALTLGMGTFAAVMALLAADDIRPPRFLLASLLIAFTISLYQSLFYSVIVIFAADLIRRFWPLQRPLGKEDFRRISWYGGLLLAGLALYALIAFAFLKWFGLELAYVTQFLKPDGGPLKELEATLIEVGSLLGGGSQAFLHHNGYYRILMAILVALLLWGLIVTARKEPGLAALILCLLLAILAAPFLQHPLNDGHLPYRTLVALPAAVALPALFAAEISPPRLRAFVLVPLAVLVAIEFSWIANRQYYGGHWSLERDKAIAADIVSRAGTLEPDKDVHSIAVVGALHRKHGKLIPRVPDTTLGASFFEWDAGSALRIAKLLSMMSDDSFEPANGEQSARAFDAATAMPSWPAAGSIARAGDTIVIKLSRPTRSQLEAVCAGRSTGICAPAAKPGD